MREGIHPDYRKVVFMDTTSGFKFLSGSTKPSKETIEWEDGNTYPLLQKIRYQVRKIKQTYLFGLSVFILYITYKILKQ